MVRIVTPVLPSKIELQLRPSFCGVPEGNRKHKAPLFLNSTTSSPAMKSRSYLYRHDFFLNCTVLTAKSAALTPALCPIPSWQA